MPLGPSVRRAIYFVLIIVVFFTIGGGVRHNVSDPIHWDVPIYLLDAKMELSGGSMLKRVDGDSILANISGYHESGLYRRISRYGNSWFIAQVLRFGPGGPAGIADVRAAYSLLLLAFLLVLYLFLGGVLSATGTSTNYGAAAVVVILTIATPLFRYLNGNPVSEVPALLLTTSSCLCFLRGLREERSWYLVPAGMLLFLAYAVRMDSCVVPAFMIVAGLAVFPGSCGRLRYWRGSFLYAAVFGTCLVGYVLVAGPIVGPHNFLRFVLNSSPLHFQLGSGTGALVVLRSLAPLLPLGVLALAGSMSRAHVFACAWFALCLTPFAVLIILGAWIETRFLAMVWPPLAVMGLLGVVRLQAWIRRLPARILPDRTRGAAVVVLVAGSVLLLGDAGTRWVQETTGWRLAVPGSEKHEYGINGVQLVVDELDRSVVPIKSLILPIKSGALRCLFRYCSRADESDPRRTGRQSRVFGALRIKSLNRDLEAFRSAAAVRLHVAREMRDQLKVDFVSRGEEWALVLGIRPRRLR